jgi:hypothetical protein
MPDDAIAWPTGGFTPVARKAPKPAKLPEADLYLAVSGKGNVTLSVAARLAEALEWTTATPLGLGAIEGEGVVFLSFAPETDGAFVLQPPPKMPENGAPRRYIVRLFKCGGIALGQRRREAVKHRCDGSVLQLAVPRAGDGAAGEIQAVKDAPKPAAAAAFDVTSLAAFACDAAAKSWPSKIDRNDQRVRVAAAVALVEFGIDRTLARETLGLGGLLLPDREDMPRPAGPAATAALEALREATEDE